MCWFLQIPSETEKYFYNLIIKEQNITEYHRIVGVGRDIVKPDYLLSFYNMFCSRSASSLNIN